MTVLATVGKGFLIRYGKYESGKIEMPKLHWVLVIREVMGFGDPCDHISRHLRIV
jgi:hypothetical protein